MSGSPVSDTTAVESAINHKKKDSWYTSTNRDSNSFVARTTVDLDDAFDAEDESTPQPFVLGHNTLKRESVGGGIVVEPEVGVVVVEEVDGDQDAQLQDVSLEGDDLNAAKEEIEAIMREENLASPPVSPPKKWRERPPTPPPLVIPSVPSREGTLTPSIVLSRDGSPYVEQFQPSRFVNVSLSPEQSLQPLSTSLSSRSPVPKPIQVPQGFSRSDVQITQSPGPSTPSARKSESSGHQTRPPVPISPSAPQISTATTPSTATHRHTKSSGISTQDVISKTRPTHLPPKSKQEDLKHMKVWEEMMQQSRRAEEQRKKVELERRLQREKQVEESVELWEREVLPDWKAALRKPHLRKLWWQGIPTKLRGKVWMLTLGNALALSKDAYRSCYARAKRAISSNSFPAESMRQIEEDILQTLPGLHLFHPEIGPMYQDLKDLVCAWLVSRSDEGLPYVRGASTIAAMFLINLPLDQAFIAMRNLLERHCLRAFYGGPRAQDDVEAYYRIFDTLLADGMPKVYFNFKQHTIPPSEYLNDWIIMVFLHHLPFEVCVRIWDVLILEGDSFLFKAAIGILSVLESRLYFPDRKELMEVLRGENKAVIEVAKRSGVLNVDMGARYEQYGMTDGALWDSIEGMDEWWRESTWSRLIQRELPDI